jgi:transcriptional regulator with XRE-family HTH domain
MTPIERVRYARKKRGLGQKALSESAGLSNAYVTHLERSLDPDRSEGTATIESPSLVVLEQLANALRVPAAWLVLGVEPEPDWDDPPDTERAHS